MGIPSNVKHAYKKLDTESQKAFRREYNRKAKSVVVCYVAWLLFGCHYAYLGNLGIQIAFWVTLGFALAVTYL